MKIVLNGLGPKDTVTFNKNIFRNGAIVEMPDDFAQAYIASNLAVEVKSEADEKEAEALQKLEAKNIRKRKAIQENIESGE